MTNKQLISLMKIAYNEYVKEIDEKDSEAFYYSEGMRAMIDFAEHCTEEIGD